MKKYFKTFKPVDFSSTARLLVSILMITLLSVLTLMYLIVSNFGLSELEIFLYSLLSGMVMFLFMDNTVGIARKSPLPDKYLVPIIISVVFFIFCNLIKKYYICIWVVTH